MANGKKTGGRKPGSKNKTTAAVKQALVEAFEQMGGVESLVAWGRRNRTEFYKLWVRMLPVELKNPDAERLRVEIAEEIVDADENAPPLDPPGPGPAPVPA
jgi:hypothetical protein